jgi:(S)-mandelate dehydrogenase
MRVDQAVNIEDLHRMAKRRLPKIAFDFIEGGLEDERGLETNTSAFHKHQLLPRYLVDCPASAPMRQIGRVEEGRISGPS